MKWRIRTCPERSYDNRHWKIVYRVEYKVGGWLCPWEYETKFGTREEAEAFIAAYKECEV